VRVGILGAGQLGRMLALAGYHLGFQFRFLDPSPESPAFQLGEKIVAAYDDMDALDRLAQGCDVVTYEFENVPVSSARYLQQRVPVYPPPGALEAAQDRLTEKTLFQNLNIPVPPFLPVDSYVDLRSAVDRIGLPCILKTRRMGYDGKGQKTLLEESDIAPAWQQLGGRPLILEGFVPYERELSVLAVRGLQGETVVYPLVENHHAGGILRLSLAPASHLTADLQAQAQAYGQRVLEALNYAGVLAIELFQFAGQLLANEMAPRVHNSGHWTIEGAVTSQFENHLRAITGCALGSAEMTGYAAMLNLIGTMPAPQEILQHPGAHLHVYSKKPRPGRKIGHVTIVDDDLDNLKSRLERLMTLVRMSEKEE
jgi:5-(carboxyamino)imidazole ribonucleotide synthase